MFEWAGDEEAQARRWQGCTVKARGVEEQQFMLHFRDATLEV